MVATPSLVCMWIFYIFLSVFPIVYMGIKRNSKEVENK